MGLDDLHGAVISAETEKVKAANRLLEKSIERINQKLEMSVQGMEIESVKRKILLLISKIKH